MVWQTGSKMKNLLFRGWVVFLLTIALLAENMNVLASAADTSDEFSAVVELLELMKTDQKSSYSDSYNISRAEFAQILVNLSEYKGNIGDTASTSIYSDVSSKYWAAPYIKTAIEEGWMSAYLDGTFKPKQKITLVEAAYGVLGILGYTSADFTGNYQKAVMSVYRKLELDEGISLNQDSKLTAAACVQLLYNTLIADVKEGNQVYAERLGYSLNLDGELEYDTLFEDALSDPIVVTDTAAWMEKLDFLDESTKYYLNDTECMAEDIGLYDVLYTSESINAIWAYENFVNGTVGSAGTNSQSGTVTIEDETYTLGTDEVIKQFSSSGSIESGDRVTVSLGRDEETVYYAKADADIFVVKNLNTWKSELGYINEATKYLLNDKECKSSDISRYSVIYSSEIENMVRAYYHPISGTVGTQSSNTQNSSGTVLIDSTSYALGNTEMTKLFSSSGSISSGDSITVYLGEDEESVYYAKKELEGPVALLTSRWYSDYSFIDTETKYYMNSVSCMKSDIGMYDVIYYSVKDNSVWAYSNIAIGTVDDIAVTSSTSAKSVTLLNGATYTLGNDDMKKKFSVSGNISKDDQVILFLDMDNSTVVYALNFFSYKGLTAGIITELTNTTVKQNGKNVKTSVITMTDVEGNEFTFNYYGYINEFEVGNCVSIYKNGTNVAVKLLDPGSIALTSYEFGSEGTSFAGYYFADNANIMEVFDGEFGFIEASSLAGRTITADDVLYMEKDDLGRITALILDDVTGDLAKYGIILGFDSDTNSYDYILDGKTSSFGAYQVDWASLYESPAKFTFTFGEITKAELLTSVFVSENSSYNSIVTSEGATMKLSDNVEVYYRTLDTNTYAYNYTKTTYGKIKDLNKYCLNAYYYDANTDGLPSADESVRMIVAYVK